jgi:hypothetical protein
MGPSLGPPAGSTLIYATVPKSPVTVRAIFLYLQILNGYEAGMVRVPVLTPVFNPVLTSKQSHSS